MSLPHKSNVVLLMVTAVLTTLFLIGTFVAAGGIVGGEEEPGEPLSFFGEIEQADGTPAPEGVEVFAIVDEDVEDNIEVDPPGQYGEEGAFEDRLVINTGSGDAVEFRVFNETGPEALESPFNFSDENISEIDPVELNLTFPDETFVGELIVDINETTSDLDVDSDEEISVEVDIENTGGAAELTQNLTAEVDEELQAAENVTLEPGETDTTTLSFDAKPAFDEQDVLVSSDDDQDRAELTVREVGELTVENLEAPTEAGQGEEISVSADIVHSNEVELTQNVTFTVTDAETDDSLDTQAEEVTLEEGQQPVSFNFTVPVDQENNINVEIATDDDSKNQTVATQDLGEFAVDIDETNAPITEGESLTVNATIENTDFEEDTQTIELLGFGGVIVDSTEVTLGPGQADTITLQWDTEVFNAGVGNVTVSGKDDDDTETVTINSNINVPGNPLGDVTETGTVDIDDAVAIQRESLGLDPGVDPADDRLFDVRRNEDVAIQDAVLAQRISLGLAEGADAEIDEFETPESVTVGDIITVNATVTNVEGDIGILEEAEFRIAEEGESLDEETTVEPVTREADIGAAGTDRDEQHIRFNVPTDTFAPGDYEIGVFIDNEYEDVNVDLLDGASATAELRLEAADD